MCDNRRRTYCSVFGCINNSSIPELSLYRLPSEQESYIFFTYITLHMMSILVFDSLSLYHAIDILDIFNITEAGAYIILHIYSLIQLYSSKMNLPHYYALHRALREDFLYICTDGSKYRKKFFETQLVTWNICFTIVTAFTIIVVGFVFFGLAILLLFLATRDPESDEPKPMILAPIWIFDQDLDRWPVYQIIFVYCACTSLITGYTYSFLLQTEIIWIRQIAAKADLVTYALEDLLADIGPAANAEEMSHNTNLIRYRMSDIVKQHQSLYRLMDHFAAVYTKCLMYEQFLCSPMICFTAYCVAEKMDQGEFHAVLLLLCITTIKVVLIPSYFCTFLDDKVRSVCDACWNTPFWNAPPVIRNYLVLMMQRSLRPPTLQSSGFQEVSMLTFSNKIMSAYSMFNLLRQTSLGNVQ